MCHFRPRDWSMWLGVPSHPPSHQARYIVQCFICTAPCMRPACEMVCCVKAVCEPLQRRIPSSRRSRHHSLWGSRVVRPLVRCSFRKHSHLMHRPWQFVLLQVDSRSLMTDQRRMPRGAASRKAPCSCVDSRRSIHMGRH